MEVPILKRQVQETPTLLPTPQISGAVPDAFGGQVAEATENLGKTGMNIGETLAKHIQQRNEELRKEKAYNEFNKISRESQELLFSPDIRTIKGSDGKDYDVPTGVLNRMENAANGAVIDYDRQIDTLYKTHTDAMDIDTKYLFDKLFIPHNESLRNRIVEHEAKQRNEAVKQGFYEFRDNTLNTLPLLDEQQKVESIKSVTDRIDELQRSGRFSYDEAEKKKNDFYAEIVEYDIFNNPDKALVELQKGSEGKYPWLTQAARTDFINQSNTRIEKLQNQEEEAIAIATNKRESDLIDMKIAETLTVPQVKKERELGAISAQFADTMIRALESPKTVKAKTDFNTYESIMADIVDPKMTATEIRVKILSAYADGKLSDEDRDSLLFVGKMGQDPVFRKSIEEQSPNMLQKAWKAVSGFFKDTIDSATAMNGIINKVKKGGTTEENFSQAIDEEIKKSRLKKYPWMNNLPQEGEIRLFPDGTKKRLYPDGRIEDVK